MMSAGMAGSLFLWRKGDDMREFAILGMLVAFSLFVAGGWLDFRNESFLKRARIAWSGRKSKRVAKDKQSGNVG